MVIDFQFLMVYGVHPAQPPPNHHQILPLSLGSKPGLRGAAVWHRVAGSELPGPMAGWLDELGMAKAVSCLGLLQKEV